MIRMFLYSLMGNSKSNCFVPSGTERDTHRPKKFPAEEEQKNTALLLIIFSNCDIEAEVGHFYFDNSKAHFLKIFTDSESYHSFEIIILSIFVIKLENDLYKT